MNTFNFNPPILESCKSRFRQLKRVLLLIFFLLFYYPAFSQSLTLFDIDTTSYPIMKAKFYAFDKDGNQILNYNTNGFEITENGEIRKILSVSCPAPKPPQALSSVLVMDVSGSMDGTNITLAQEGARAWIRGLPLGKSECAITTFDTKNYFVQDFTTDRNLLESKILDVYRGGGTDYNSAFTSPAAGGILVAKTGKYKKVIVLLSDGQPNFEPNTKEIIKQANQYGITIFSVTLGYQCPQCLKSITESTGGQWFENVTTTEQAREVYLKILNFAQGSDPCTIEWENKALCNTTNFNVVLKYNITNSFSTLNYSLSKLKTSYLETIPLTAKLIGSLKDTCTKVTIKAVNDDFDVYSIIPSNPSFRVEPSGGFHIRKGKSRELKVCYTAADSGSAYCKFEIDNSLCSSSFYATGGLLGKRPAVRTLKLIHPNGGEVFVAGSDTLITWEGVAPDNPVSIEYSTNSGANWISIEKEATGLSYKWRIPKTPSNQCLARVTALSGLIFADIDMAVIPPGSFLMGATGAHKDGEKVHKVNISKPFLMSRYEVTQKQYKIVMNNNPSNNTGDSLPVENVSWVDAINFCNNLSLMEGLEPCYNNDGAYITCNWGANGYRLPTEAEWEFACKAGTTTDFYNGDMSKEWQTVLDAYLDEIGWYQLNSNELQHEAGSKTPNSLGLFDMSGNLWEWCWDFYESYKSGEVTDPKGPFKGNVHVIRGGAWNSNASACRSASRYNQLFGHKDRYTGFRIVRSNF